MERVVFLGFKVLIVGSFIHKNLNKFFFEFEKMFDIYLTKISEG